MYNRGYQKSYPKMQINLGRDVTAGATGVTKVAPKFSDALTLFQPGGADSAQHCKGRTKNFPVVTSLLVKLPYSAQKLLLRASILTLFFVLIFNPV